MIKTSFARKKEMLLIIMTVILLAALMYVTGSGCPILKLTGIPCFGCGMTRAVLCLFQCDFAGAWYYHPMVYLMPFCTVALLMVKHMSKRLIKTILAAVVALFVIVYLIRLADPANEVVKWQIESGTIGRMISGLLQSCSE